MKKSRTPQAENTAVDTKVWAIPSSNCAAHFVLAKWRRIYVSGWFVYTRATISDRTSKFLRLSSAMCAFAATNELQTAGGHCRP